MISCSISLIFKTLKLAKNNFSAARKVLCVHALRVRKHIYFLKYKFHVITSVYMYLAHEINSTRFEVCM